MNRSFFQKFLPRFIKKWLDTSNMAFAKHFRAIHGVLTFRKVQQVVDDTSTPTICFCPLCAKAIKTGKNGQVGVWLSHRDRTPDDPEVRVAKKQTLFVSYKDQEYQVCCSDCSPKHSELPDRFGHIDQNGNLINATPRISRHLPSKPPS